MEKAREKTVLDDLIGRTVRRIGFNKNQLRFETSEGKLDYVVEGGCCSHSEFWDFFGVEHLLNNGAVISVATVPLDPSDGRPSGGDDSTQYYGYKITTLHPKFDEVTTVLSFRNMSNGYYGGWMEKTDYKDQVLPFITTDVTEAA